jgi:hypothetical protein
MAIVQKAEDAPAKEELNYYFYDFISFIKPYEGELWREGGFKV